MKGEPLDIPKGRILYTDANGATGLFINGPYMASFCSAVEIMITQWREWDSIAALAQKELAQATNVTACMTLSNAIADANARCEVITDRLKGMLETVTVLGIEPLVTWLTGRLEQEDM